MNIFKQLFVISLIASSLAGNLFGAKPGRTTYGETKRSESETNATTAASSSSATPATPAVVAAPTDASASSVATPALPTPQAPLLLTYVPDAPEAIRLPYTPTIPEPLTPEIFGSVYPAPLPKTGIRSGWGTTLPSDLFAKIFSYLPNATNPNTILELFRARRMCKLFYEQLRGQKIIILINLFGSQIPRSVDACARACTQAAFKNRYQFARVILFAAQQAPYPFFDKILPEKMSYHDEEGLKNPDAIDEYKRSLPSRAGFDGHNDICTFILNTRKHDIPAIIEVIIRIIKNNPKLLSLRREKRIIAGLGEVRGIKDSSYYKNKKAVIDTNDSDHKYKQDAQHIDSLFFDIKQVLEINEFGDGLNFDLAEKIIQALKNHSTISYACARLVHELGNQLCEAQQGGLWGIIMHGRRARAAAQAAVAPVAPAAAPIAAIPAPALGHPAAVPAVPAAPIVVAPAPIAAAPAGGALVGAAPVAAAPVAQAVPVAPAVPTVAVAPVAAPLAAAIPMPALGNQAAIPAAPAALPVVAPAAQTNVRAATSGNLCTNSSSSAPPQRLRSRVGAFLGTVASNVAGAAVGFWQGFTSPAPVEAAPVVPMPAVPPTIGQAPVAAAPAIHAPGAPAAH